MWSDTVLTLSGNVWEEPCCLSGFQTVEGATGHRQGVELLYGPTPLMLDSLCLCLVGSDPGLLLRLLGRHQAGVLDEGRDALEVLPQTVHLPPGHEHQPVLPHHHPASGTPAGRRRDVSAPLTCLLPAALHSAHHRRGRNARLLPLWGVVVGQRPGDRRHGDGGLLRGVRPRSEETGLRPQQLCR